MDSSEIIFSPNFHLKVFEEFKERAELHFYSKGEDKSGTNGRRIRVSSQSESISHYSPESNGISERLNRTLLDMARSMLFGANLSDKLWTEAVSTTIYLKNRLPHSSLLGDIIPHER